MSTTLSKPTIQKPSPSLKLKAFLQSSPSHQKKKSDAESAENAENEELMRFQTMGVVIKSTTLQSTNKANAQDMQSHILPSSTPVTLISSITKDSISYVPNSWLLYFNTCLIQGRGTNSHAFNGFYAKFKDNPKAIFMNDEMHHNVLQVNPDFQPLKSDMISRIVPSSDVEQAKEGNAISFVEFRDLICANVLLKRTNKDIRQSYILENAAAEMHATNRRDSILSLGGATQNNMSLENLMDGMRDPPLNIDPRSSIAESLFRLCALTPQADLGNVASIQHKILHTGFLGNNECFLSILLLLFLIDELSELYYVPIHSVLSKEAMHYEHTTSRPEFKKMVERFWLIVQQLSAGVGVDMVDESLENFAWESLHETFTIAGEKRAQIRVTRALELLVGMMVSFCGIMVFVKQIMSHLDSTQNSSSNRKKANQIVKSMLTRGLTLHQLTQFLQSIQRHPSLKKIEESLEDEFNTQNAKQVLSYGSILKYFAKLFVQDNRSKDANLTKALTVEKLERGNVIMFVRRDFMEQQMSQFVRPQPQSDSSQHRVSSWWQYSGEYEAFLIGNKKMETRYTLSKEIQDMFVNTAHFPKQQGAQVALPPPVLFGVVHHILRAEHRIFASISGATFIPPQDGKQWIRQYFHAMLQQEVDALETRLNSRTKIPALLQSLHPTHGKHSFVIKLPVYFFNQLFHFTTLSEKGKLQCTIRNADELCSILTYYDEARETILRRIPLSKVIRRFMWPKNIPSDYYLQLHISENNPLVVTILDELNAEISCYFRILTRSEVSNTDKSNTPDLSYNESLAAEDLQFNVVYLGNMDQEFDPDASREEQLKERVKRFICPDGSSMKHSLCVEPESKWECRIGTEQVRIIKTASEVDDQDEAIENTKKRRYELRPFVAVRALTLTNFLVAIRLRNEEFMVLPNRLITASEYARFSDSIRDMLSR